MQYGRQQNICLGEDVFKGEKSVKKEEWFLSCKF